MKKILSLLVVGFCLLLGTTHRTFGSTDTITVVYPNGQQWTKVAIKLVADSLDVNATGKKISSYQWSFGDGSKDSTTSQSVMTHYFQKTGTFQLRLTRVYTDGTTDVSKDVANITLYNSASPFTIEYSKRWNHDRNCARFSIKFRANTTDTSALGYVPYKYQWQFEDDTITRPFSLRSDTIHVFQNADTFTVKLFRQFVQRGTTTVLYTDSVIKDILILDKPNIVMSRKTVSPKCVNDTTSQEILTVTVYEPRADSIFAYFKNGEIIDGNNKQDSVIIPNLHDTVFVVKYTKSSCGFDLYGIDGSVICEDCFVPVLYAENYCGKSPFFANPADFKVFNIPNPPSDELTSLDATNPLRAVSTSNYSICVDASGNGYNLNLLDKMTSQKGKGGPADAGGGVCDTVEYSEIKVYKDNINITNQVTLSEPAYTPNAVGSRSVDINIPVAGNYVIRSVHFNGCSVDSSVFTDNFLVMNNNPIIDMDRADATNPIKCYPSLISLINLTNNISQIDSFNWRIITPEGDTTKIKAGGDTISVLRHIFGQRGQYRIYLDGTAKGCGANDSLDISLDQPCDLLVVPNAFIPESSNEKFKTFRPVAHMLREYRIEIYNTWGELLWENTEIDLMGTPKTGWDGTYKNEPCMPGLYIWKITAKFEDGSTEGYEWPGQPEDKPKRVGTFTLIR